MRGGKRIAMMRQLEDFITEHGEKTIIYTNDTNLKLVFKMSHPNVQVKVFPKGTRFGYYDANKISEQIGRR